MAVSTILCAIRGTALSGIADRYCPTSGATIDDAMPDTNGDNSAPTDQSPDTQPELRTKVSMLPMNGRVTERNVYNIDFERVGRIATGKNFTKMREMLA